VRPWLFAQCGACFLSSGEWDEARYDAELRECMRAMDPRHRGIPFFIPMPLPKKRSHEEDSWS